MAGPTPVLPQCRQVLISFLSPADFIAFTSGLFWHSIAAAIPLTFVSGLVQASIADLDIFCFLFTSYITCDIISYERN